MEVELWCMNVKPRCAMNRLRRARFFVFITPVYTHFCHQLSLKAWTWDLCVCVCVCVCVRIWIFISKFCFLPFFFFFFSLQSAYLLLCPYLLPPTPTAAPCPPSLFAPLPLFIKKPTPVLAQALNILLPQKSVVVADCFYIAHVSSLEQTHWTLVACDSKLVTSFSWCIFEYIPMQCTYSAVWLLMAGATWNCCCRSTFCVRHATMSRHFMWAFCKWVFTTIFLLLWTPHLEFTPTRP